jgi:hypothetical protein
VGGVADRPAGGHPVHRGGAPRRGGGARARDPYVTGHAHNVASIRSGLQAGLECFAHGAFLEEPTAAQLAAAGAALVPTLTTIRLLATEWQAWGVPGAVLPRVAGAEEAMREAVKLADAAGVMVGSGTDILGPRAAPPRPGGVLRGNRVWRAFQSLGLGLARVVGQLDMETAAGRPSAQPGEGALLHRPVTPATFSRHRGCPPRDGRGSCVPADRRSRSAQLGP